MDDMPNFKVFVSKGLIFYHACVISDYLDISKKYMDDSKYYEYEPNEMRYIKGLTIKHIKNKINKYIIDVCVRRKLTDSFDMFNKYFNRDIDKEKDNE